MSTTYNGKDRNNEDEARGKDTNKINAHKSVFLWWEMWCPQHTKAKAKALVAPRRKCVICAAFSP